MGIYADVRNSKIANVVEADANYAAQFGLVDIGNLNPRPGVGWATQDGGSTWQPPAVDPSITNQADLQSKLAAALQANSTYLAIASPSTAQNTAQIKRLTQEVNAVIRVLLGQLDTTAGT